VPWAGQKAKFSLGCEPALPSATLNNETATLAWAAVCSLAVGMLQRIAQVRLCLKLEAHMKHDTTKKYLPGTPWNGGAAWPTLNTSVAHLAANGMAGLVLPLAPYASPKAAATKTRFPFPLPQTGGSWPIARKPGAASATWRRRWA